MNRIIFAAIISFCASVVAVLSGFGAGTIMVSALSMTFPFAETVVLSAFIHWVISLITLIFFWEGIDWKLIIGFCVPAIISTIIGVYVLSYIKMSNWLLRCFGLFLIMYVVFLWIFPQFKLKKKVTNMVVGGSLSGFTKGLFGVGGGIRTVVLSAFDLPKKSYLSTGAAINIVIDTVRIASYWYQGITLSDRLRSGMPLFIVAAIIGGIVAKYCVNLVPQSSFRILVTFFLLIAGIWMLMR